MKKRFSLIVLVLLSVLLFNLKTVSAADNSCILDASLAYQDPYPAVSGDYVDVLFQISQVSGNCNNGAFTQLVLDYPFSLDSKDYARSLGSSTYYGTDYSSKWNVLYKIRVDKDAVAKDYEIELRYGPNQNANNQTYSYKKFTINVEDGTTDFEVHVQNYKIKDRQLTLEVLNTGNQDISALTLEIPKQDNIQVYGSNRNILGDLDSKDYTTADFEAVPVDGDINLDVYYTDATNTRRLIKKVVHYDSSYFTNSLENQVPNQTGTYVTLGIIAVALFLIYHRRKKSKKKKLSDI